MPNMMTASGALIPLLFVLLSCTRGRALLDCIHTRNNKRNTWRVAVLTGADRFAQYRDGAGRISGSRCI
jgi:hypothetical protein